MGLPYPGGPVIDRLAKEGNPNAFDFAKPRVPGLDFSFSGLKTSFLYFIRDSLKHDPQFIEKNRADLAASVQSTIIDILMEKLVQASKETGIQEIGISGGVSANSGLRTELIRISEENGWKYYYPEIQFTTDNAAMIALTGYYKFIEGQFSSHDVIPMARFTEGLK